MIQCPNCCLYSEDPNICGVCGFNFHSDPIPQYEELLFATPPAICPSCGYISSDTNHCLACGTSLDAEELMRCALPIGGSIAGVGGIIDEFFTLKSSKPRHDLHRRFFWDPTALENTNMPGGSLYEFFKDESEPNPLTLP